jgi:3(or 17)beta-hydroxysteroid dehydrogenase
MTGRLRGKTALVTGAASGIGREIAREFDREGASLILADIDESGMRETGSRLDASRETLRLDVTNEADWRHAEEFIRALPGKLDVAVNAAGISPERDTIEDCDVARWNRILEVNLSGTFLGCRTAVGLMKETGGGSIINIGSIRSIVASSTTLAYSTTKAGILGLTKSVALHCAEKRYGIRANVICPGGIATPMNDEKLSRESDPEAALEAWAAAYPIGRLGTPRDVARMAVYLASEDADFVTGAHFMIDGGFTAK